MYRYFKTLVEGGSTCISSWESKGLSNEKISSITTSNYSQVPKLVYHNARIKLSFNTDLLKQDKVTYNNGPIVNIYTAYELNTLINDSGVTLENCLFGAVKLTKNPDIAKYKYFGWSIGFDSKGYFSYPSGGDGKNVIIFGADLSSSKHVNNQTRSILVFGKDFIQGIDGATIYAEKIYSTNFTVPNKKF